MNIDDFDYALPDSLIAQSPLMERTSSKLMTVNKHTGVKSHHRFEELVHFLEPGDLVIANNSKVIPARLIGVKRETQAKVEVLILHEKSPMTWEALVRPAKRLKVGTVIDFGITTDSTTPILTATIVEEQDMGIRTLQFSCNGIFREVLEQLGQMPLPPYITEQLADRERYQTVFAKQEGSVAAPTAGLHFNQAYIDQLTAKGIRFATIVLHVGIGTFRPVSVERIEEHEMHAEYYEVSQDVVELINQTRAQGKRIVAIGTTTARTLETIANRCNAECNKSQLDTLCKQDYRGWTNIFIYPGYSFQVVDALLTNFHLPKSTLLMMISALSRREYILDAYQEAIKERYRFFSFGDAMFIY